MQKTLLSLLMVSASASALAQSPAKTDPVAKPVAKAQPKPKAPPKSASRTEISSTAKNMAAGIEAADAALTPVELAIAEKVHTGVLPCELGAAVTVTADPKTPGYFNVQAKKVSYRMAPIPTTTGAIRLEDPKAGAVWMQLGNKSMLLNQKLGQRLADECVSPQQALVAQQLKITPAQSVLEPLAPATSAK